MYRWFQNNKFTARLLTIEEHEWHDQRTCVLVFSASLSNIEHVVVCHRDTLGVKNRINIWWKGRRANGSITWCHGKNYLTPWQARSIEGSSSSTAYFSTLKIHTSPMPGSRKKEEVNGGTVGLATCPYRIVGRVTLHTFYQQATLSRRASSKHN